MEMTLRSSGDSVTSSFSTLYSSLDPRPDERGRQFERVVKWFLKHDPAWTTQVDDVWLWNEWPERWGADCGIDLIFRHKNGEVWAVQAKCYSPDYTVTKHDVDRFLSESSRALIHGRLLVATTDRIGTNAMRVCEAQEKPVVLFRLSWNFWFGLLVAYVQEHGNAWVSAKYVTRDGYKLGMWVNGQRNAKLNGQLSEERIRPLESLKGWVWDAYREKWDTGFAALSEYVRAHGDAKVPMTYITPQGFGLGNWISTARRKKSLNRISSERISKLESIPGWSWSILEDSWEDGFEALERYVAERGDARVPTTYVTTSGYKLGDWIYRQRRLRLKQGLDPSFALRLEGLPGWSWESQKLGPRVKLRWEDAFKKLLEFQEREGHVLVPQHYQTSDGFRLGFWVHYQRKAVESMPADRRGKLEELPTWRWNVRVPGNVRAPREVWEAALQELREFVRSEGHARVPKDYRTKSGFRLGGWVQSQRSEVERLPADSKAQLEALPRWAWNALTDRWEDGVRYLAEFVERKGHARVKQDFVAEDGYRLGSWAQNQRARRDKMSPERKARLEALPGWMWAADSPQWDDWINLLKEFSRQNGHTRVPQLFKTSDGFLLGRWVNSRRTQRDRLSPDQQSELESLPGWVWRVI